MQTPTLKTPVDRCEQLSLYTQRMLSKFSDRPALIALIAPLAGATEALLQSQNELVTAARGLIAARVDVRYADIRADQGVRAAQRKAELADAERPDKKDQIAARLFPNGVTPIVKPFGPSQVTAMEALEGRFPSVSALWPESAAVLANLVPLREQYKTALNARSAARRTVGTQKALRDGAKEDFLDVYAEVIARVKAEFPRDTTLQEIFFDKLESSDSSAPDDEGDAPTPTPTPTP